MELKKTRKPLLRFAAALLIVPIFLMLLGGCEQIFTYSPLTWAQRDPSNLPIEQRIAYAEAALSGGDAATLKAAYDAIKNNTDPDVQYLAAKVAVGASGLNEAVSTAFSSVDSIEDLNPDEILDSIDSTWITNAETSLLSAHINGAHIAAEDYLTVTAMLLIKDAKANGNTFEDLGVFDLTDPANADSGGTDIQKAAFFFQESGYSADNMDSLIGLIGG
jgi:hypothetical protein